MSDKSDSGVREGPISAQVRSFTNIEYLADARFLYYRSRPEPVIPERLANGENAATPVIRNGRHEGSLDCERPLSMPLLAYFWLL